MGEREAPWHHPLSLAAGTLPEFPPEAVAEAAARSGFRQVGFTIDPGAWTERRGLKLRRMLDAEGLQVLDVEVAWIPAGGAVTDGHRRLLDIGAALGATHLLTVSDEADPGRAGDALRVLCEQAASCGMRVALEFLMITALHSLDAALAVIRHCDHPAAALLIDALHLQRAGHRPGDLAAIPPALLSYAQLCDGSRDCAADPAAYLRDALDLRSAPDEGELPLRPLLDALPAGCPLSLEIRSARYRAEYPIAADRAAAIRRRTLDFLAATG